MFLSNYCNNNKLFPCKNCATYKDAKIYMEKTGLHFSLESKILFGKFYDNEITILDLMLIRPDYIKWLRTACNNQKIESAAVAQKYWIASNAHYYSKNIHKVNDKIQLELHCLRIYSLHHYSKYFFIDEMKNIYFAPSYLVQSNQEILTGEKYKIIANIRKNVTNRHIKSYKTTIIEIIESTKLST